MPNQSCSSGVEVMLIGCVPRAARPRRGWSIRYTGKRRRRNMFWNPSRPSGVVSHVLADCPWPCQKTRGSFLAFTGTW
jgi:hypothetical protein